MIGNHIQLRPEAFWTERVGDVPLKYHVPDQLQFTIHISIKFAWSQLIALLYYGVVPSVAGRYILDEALIVVHSDTQILVLLQVVDDLLLQQQVLLCL